MDAASSESFLAGLKALFARHPDLKDRAQIAHRWTEILETYGDVVKRREELLAKRDENSMLLGHYEQSCKELEDYLATSFRRWPL
jgi:hypothetical protein